MASSLPLNDRPPSSLNSAKWKHIVRNIWNKPLNEREIDTLLSEGELTLVCDVNRVQFLASFDDEDDDFTRGMEWRAVGDAHHEIGDIVLIRLPVAPHETAAGALTRAVTRSIDRITLSPSIGLAIVSTGATRYTGGWWNSFLRTRWRVPPSKQSKQSSFWQW